TPHRLHLRGDRGRARLVRRRCRCPDLRADRRARLQDGDPRGGRILEAARHGPDRDLRSAGVRDHRRRHAGDPAHRGDAPVHQLRRQLDRRQLHPAGAAADDLRQGAPPGAAGERGGGPVNRQIVKLFGFVLVLYALLFGFTSYWSIFDAKSLRANTANRRPLLEEEKIQRGSILADDGTVIARSTPQGKGNNKIYVRHYPLGGLFGNPIGYSFVTQGRVGFESSHNDELVGNKTEFLSILDELQGHAQVGDSVQSSLDPAAQRAAVDGLAGRRGAVVAMVPSTGEIRAMVSIPEYDPNRVPNHLAQLNKDPSAPLFNRATQAGYPPGSTMKVVTATAALDSGDLSPSSTFSGRSPITIEGVPLSNSGGEQFGTIDMTTAL